jgi:putative pyrroloquinoline-quinone-binding quinoprotein
MIANPRRAMRKMIRRALGLLVIVMAAAGLTLAAPDRVEAAASNVSTFAFKNSTSFGSGTNNWDMQQGYAGGTSTGCPSAIGNNWTCTFSSDTFTAGQSMAAGSATVSLYVNTNLATSTTGSTRWASATANSTSISVAKPSGVASGDLMVAGVNPRAPADTITAPAGWVLRRSGRNTHEQLAIFTKTYAGEAGPYVFSWTTSGRTAAGIVAFTNLDTTNPIHNDWYTASSSTFTTARSAPSITTSLPNAMILALWGVVAGATTAGTHPTVAGMSEALDIAAGNGGNFAGFVADYALQAATGATGVKSMTSTVSGAYVGATVALKPLTGTLTVQLLQNTTVIGSTTVAVGPGTALYTVHIPTTTSAFATGDRLKVRVIAPSTFNSQILFNSASQLSRLVTPTLGTADASLQWSYATAAATMGAPGLDPWTGVVIAGSNDNNLYSISETTGGLAFTNGPFLATAPIQGRPAMVPAAFRTPASTENITIASAQDGYVYAVDTGTGAQVWKSPLLGTKIQAGPTIWLQALKTLTICNHAVDMVIVATANTGDTTTNKVYALNASPNTISSSITANCNGQWRAPGDIMWTFQPGNMDIISSTPHVDYTNNAIWVTTRSKNGTQAALWKLNAANGVLIASWTTASLGDSDTTAASGIDSAPVASSDGSFIYVGTNGTSSARLAAIPGTATTSNTGAITFNIGGTTPAPCNCTGTGPVEGMPWPLGTDPVSTGTPDTIILTRSTTVHSINFTGAAFSANWTATLTGTPTLSAPVDDGMGHLYIGGSDGKVHQVDVATGTDQAQVPETAISGTMGDPTFNPNAGTVVIGGSDGHIYTFQTPF